MYNLVCVNFRSKVTNEYIEQYLEYNFILFGMTKAVAILQH